MKVLVCGGRDFCDVLFLSNTLDRLNKLHGPFKTIIEGNARGADQIAGGWAMDRGINLMKIPADWEKHGRSAGIIRNIEMLDLKPDLVIAFNGGRGTDHTVSEAKKRGIKTMRFSS